MRSDDELSVVIDGNAVTAIKAVEALADDYAPEDFARMAELEAAGRNRKTVLAAIEAAEDAAQLKAAQAQPDEDTDPTENDESGGRDAALDDDESHTPPGAAGSEDGADDATAPDAGPGGDDAVQGAAADAAGPSAPADDAGKPADPEWMADDYTGPLTGDQAAAILERRRERREPGKAARGEQITDFKHPDYSGPLTGEQAEWRMQHLRTK